MSIPNNVLVVGAGLYGTTMAQYLTEHGVCCTVIDKRPHVAGNCYTSEKNGIHVHEYGPHIFHTNSEEVWNYVNRFTKFHPYKHVGYTIHTGTDGVTKRYPMPFNRTTAEMIYNLSVALSGDEIKKYVDTQALPWKCIVEEKFKDGLVPAAKEWICAQVGEKAYEILYAGYTTKQWDRFPQNLPYSIVARLPIRFTLESNWYKDDKYQGIPVDGYTKMVERMLDGIPVHLGLDFKTFQPLAKQMCDTIVYTGPIDAYFDYKYGPLDWRSLRFQRTSYNDVTDFQGAAVINFADANVQMTRSVEHKHFLPIDPKNNTTIVTDEFPAKYNHKDPTSVPYYPIEDQKNKALLEQYKALAKLEPNVIFGGRLAEYKYYDMHQVIGAALSKAKELVNQLHTNKEEPSGEN